MKKLGKKIQDSKETIQSYCSCSCGNGCACACPGSPVQAGMSSTDSSSYQSAYWSNYGPRSSY